MTFLQLCSERYSCRKYDGRPVDRNIIGRCIEAARLAPSACNSQPWFYIVVDSPKLKEDLGQAAFAGIYSINSFAKAAPVLVVIVREKSKYVAQLAGRMRGVEYSLIDLGISVEHFILQAAEEGVGSCWLGWFNIEGTRGILGLESNAQVDAIISLGYPPAALAGPKREKVRKKRDAIFEFR